MIYLTQGGEGDGGTRGIGRQGDKGTRGQGVEIKVFN